MRAARAHLLLTALLALVTVPSAGAGEQVENPNYTNWASFKPGASATHRVTIENAGKKMELTATLTLMHVTAETVVLRERITVPGADAPFEAEQTHPRMIDAGELDPLDAAMRDPQTRSGVETVAVNGKPIECTWYEFSGQKDGDTLKGRAWMSPAVPGHGVKLAATSQRQGKITSTLESYTTGEG